MKILWMYFEKSVGVELTGGIIYLNLGKIYKWKVIIQKRGKSLILQEIGK